MTIYRSTIQLLRIPFSINLLPIFLFAFYSCGENIHTWKAALVFILIHFVFYPASNAYNSFMDADTSSIAGIKNPPAPTKQLYQASVLLDIVGLSLSLLISLPFFAINFILMLLSRAYSYRGIRLKKYAVLSFIMVAFAQGGLSFYNMFIGIQGLDYFPALTIDLALKVAVASLFVGAIYPITQVYQHEEDEKQGDQTMSMLLGVRGTFVFSGFLFLLANVCLYFILTTSAFLIFEAFMIFPAGFFIFWAYQCFKDPLKANFKSTMRMAMSASIAMILGFAVIILTT
ncbi:UbiA family prenyltransferase [Portibacter lacus]|uniref:Prenyltransferase n=1 Tax=Portibacter lacus TaxID=1099794 RepID=A0AA37WDT5_9BACT|nr:UbiA family prenyltransferase [Portibacter lacus]GLR16347.1 hypothetical protein GCM10007940_09620 [Portibacter lacus]